MQSQRKYLKMLNITLNLWFGILLNDIEWRIFSSSTDCSLVLWFSCNWQEKFELWWELIFSVESVWEVNSSDSAVSMDLNSESFYVVCTISSSGEIRQVELNLVPSFIESHRHCAYEWLYPCSWLVVWCSESTSYWFVIQYLNFESEIFLQVLNDHDQERKLDGKSLLWIKRSIDIVGWYISSHDFKNWWLNIWISYSFDVTVSHLLVPNLQWLRSKNIWLLEIIKIYDFISEEICWNKFSMINFLLQRYTEDEILTQWNREWKGNHSDKLS